jgi:hypothetical protein
MKEALARLHFVVDPSAPSTRPIDNAAPRRRGPPRGPWARVVARSWSCWTRPWTHKRASRSERKPGRRLTRKFLASLSKRVATRRKCLSFAEEALDQVALSIDAAIDGSTDEALAGRGDVRLGSGGPDELEQGIGSVAAISDDMPAFEAGQQLWGGAQSWACPAVSSKRTGRPFSSTTALILVLSPPRERPMA